MDRCRKLGSGTKSASKIAMNSPLAVFSPFSNAPALKPRRSLRWTYSMSKPSACGPGHGLAGDLDRLVGAVVQHLDLELVARVVDPAGLLDDPPGDTLLVVHRQLHRHRRQVREAPLGLGLLLVVTVVQEHQQVTVQAVDRHHQHGDGVDPT